MSVCLNVCSLECFLPARTEVDEQNVDLSPVMLDGARLFKDVIRMFLRCST